MDDDIDSIVKTRRNKLRSCDDFPSMFTDLIKSINWKIAMFIFLMGVFLFSDVFIESFLINFDNAVEGDCATNKGTLIQLSFLTAGYIIFDLLVRGGL